VALSKILEYGESLAGAGEVAKASKSVDRTRTDRQVAEVERDKAEALAEKSEKESVRLADAEEATRQLNEIAKLANPRLTFTIDRDLDAVIITVIDKNTDEVIRQIPPEEVLSRMKRRKELEEYFTGLFADDVV
jgi:flagellar protein FlaG